MGKLVLPFSYKELQIIRHALLSHLLRENATGIEVIEENKLLDKITNEVNDFKVKMKIQ